MSPIDFVNLRAPEYSADPRMGNALVQAATEIGTAYGDNQYKAIALQALHWLAMDDRAAGVNGAAGTGSVGGTLNMEQEGSLKRAYTVDFSFQAKYPDLSMSRWGMELIGLTKKTALNFLTRRVSV